MKINKKHFLYKKTAAFLMAGLLTVSFLGGCQQKKEDTSVSDIKVETRAAETGVLEIRSEYIAVLTPNLTVDVVPLVAGTVKWLPVKVGDRVKAGDVLCQLDDTSAELSVKSAQDAVRSAEAGKDVGESQADSAKIQADGNVKTLKKTLKTYKDSLDTAEKQLKKLKESKKSIQKSQNASKQAYANAKKKYKTAQALLIQFEAFLNDNPDCKTTAGLTAAATTIPSGSGLNNASGTTGSNEAGVTPDSSAANGQAGSAGDSSVRNGSAGSQTESQSGTDVTTDGSAAYAAKQAARQKQAQALMTALSEAGLTVEYLSTNGISALAEDAKDSETAFSTAGSGAAQLDTSIATLEGNITQLKTQIQTTKDSLATAEKLADAASAGSEVYDAQIEAAKTGVEAARYQQDLYRLTAPIDGIVDAVNVKEEGMAAQGMAAFTVSEKNSMIAAFYVTEDVKNFLKIGDEVALLKSDDEEETEDLGHITSVGTAVDPQKGLFKVEAEIVTTGQKKLSSGSSVKLSVISNAVSGQLLIPYDSVYYDDGQAYVYKVTDGQAVRTDVETGTFNQENIAITSGLNEGDVIITTWASGLKDGAKVEVVDGEESK